jgi:hypothetical protein
MDEMLARKDRFCCGWVSAAARRQDQELAA